MMADDGLEALGKVTEIAITAVEYVAVVSRFGCQAIQPHAPSLSTISHTCSAKRHQVAKSERRKRRRLVQCELDSWQSPFGFVLYACRMQLSMPKLIDL
jgi:hypothetical protein